MKSFGRRFGGSRFWGGTRVLARIAADPRHGGEITLQQGFAEGRQFPDWSMGFRDLNSDKRSTQGYNEFLNAPLTGQEFSGDPSRAQKLLLTFKRTM